MRLHSYLFRSFRASSPRALSSIRGNMFKPNHASLTASEPRHPHGHFVEVNHVLEHPFLDVRLLGLKLRETAAEFKVSSYPLTEEFDY